jgi:hypothetical protein
MYYVVPKDRSVIKQKRSFELLRDAKRYALEIKDETGENFDIICMERVWTTQTFDEAHKLSLDIPHIGRD